MNNNMNYSTVTEPAKKVTIVIARKQLWDNYVNGWKELAWEDTAIIQSLKNVSDVLCVDGPMDYLKLRALFRSGETVFLLSDAMGMIDVPHNQNVYNEVVVTDTDGKTITIRHEDICY